AITSSTDYSFKDQRSKALNEYSTQLIRELIIPKLTKEVNSSKCYAPLRQVYYSLIMAQWFKARFKGKQGAYYNRIDRQDLTNLTSKEDWSKTTYFNAYKKSFTEGEYNIQESHYTPTGQVIRSYFSGGIRTKINMPNAGGNGEIISLPAINNKPPTNNEFIPVTIGKPNFNDTKDYQSHTTKASSSIKKLPGPQSPDTGTGLEISAILDDKKFRDAISKAFQRGTEDYIKVLNQYIIRVKKMRAMFDVKRVAGPAETNRLIVNFPGSSEEQVLAFVEITLEASGRKHKSNCILLLSSKEMKIEKIYVLIMSAERDALYFALDEASVNPELSDTVELISREFTDGYDSSRYIDRVVTSYPPGPGIPLFCYGHSQGDEQIIREMVENSLILKHYFSSQYVQNMRLGGQLLILSKQSPRIGGRALGDGSLFIDADNFIFGRPATIYQIARNGKMMEIPYQIAGGADFSPDRLEIFVHELSHLVLENVKNQEPESYKKIMDVLTALYPNYKKKLYGDKEQELFARVIETLSFIKNKRIRVPEIDRIDEPVYKEVVEILIQEGIIPPEIMGMAEFKTKSSSPAEQEEKRSALDKGEGVSILPNAAVPPAASESVSSAVELELPTDLLKRISDIFLPAGIIEQLPAADEIIEDFPEDEGGILAAEQRDEWLEKVVSIISGLPAECKEKILRLLALDNNSIIQIRDLIRQRLMGTYESLSDIADGVDAVLIEEGVDIPDLKKRIFLNFRNKGDPEINPKHETIGALLDVLKLQFFPQDVPVYRSVQKEFAGLPGKMGINSSDWGVGRSGLLTALSYFDKTKKDTVIIQSTIGELRNNGTIIYDYYAVGNAVSLVHHIDLEKPVFFSVVQASSPSITREAELGGIDFRSLPIVTQALTNLSANISSSAINRLSSVNLNEEWQSIERMTSSGIKPSSDRIKEYAQASSALGNISQDKDKIILCISVILRQEEEQNCETDPVLRDILVVLESIQKPQELKEVFLGKIT
ncbi:MAG: hypothetical protein PHF69_07330, partial [Candidatus Omnitrophica bacterium]|nr:hypothetical protein [Candidatus Omnitrophota bacterium]